MSAAHYQYDSKAVIDDGSCIVLGCTDSRSEDYDPLANHEDGIGCSHFLFPGCTDSTAANYRPLSKLDDGSCDYIGCMDSDAINFDPTATSHGAGCIDRVEGCTSTAAANFHPSANIDDNQCVFEGCTDSRAKNFDPTANQDVLNCILVYGCTSTNPHAINYDPSADIDDGSCIIVGCTDPTNANYDPEANQPVPQMCASSRRELQDLLNLSQTRNNPIISLSRPSLLDNKRGLELGGCCSIQNASNFDPNCSAFDECSPLFSCCRYSRVGCMDAASPNFDPSANKHSPEMCVQAVHGCVVPFQTLNFNSLANSMTDCVYSLRGCTDPNASNFNPHANVDNGRCRYDIPGCMRPSAINFDSTATVSAHCIPRRVGCVDLQALNAVPDATLPINDCVYAHYGCTLDMARNVDPLANVDDGSCIIDTSSSDSVTTGASVALDTLSYSLGAGAVALIALAVLLNRALRSSNSKGIGLMEWEGQTLATSESARAHLGQRDVKQVAAEHGDDRAVVLGVQRILSPTALSSEV